MITESKIILNHPFLYHKCLKTLRLPIALLERGKPCLEVMLSNLPPKPTLPLPYYSRNPDAGKHFFPPPRKIIFHLCNKLLVSRL